MKKEENQKINTSPLKHEHDLRSRSHSPKAYLGCDTCKQKNSEAVKKVKSISRFSDYGSVIDRYKLKKTLQEKEKEREKERDVKKPKIKLTDLCDEDKKRIIELIEELSKFAEKNQQLQEAFDCMQSTRQEQQDYIMKQANLHLEEKNFLVNEINEYKFKIESAENELKNKMYQWENHERYLDTEIAYLAKALQKLLKEKNELNDQLNHLKTCLRHSLESFQRLRAEVSNLQRQEQITKKYKSVFCQTDSKPIGHKEIYKHSEEDTEEDEYLSTCNPETVDAKSSLDIINDKLEHVYQLLMRKSESLTKNNLQKFDIDLSILLKNEKLDQPGGNEANLQHSSPDGHLKEDNEEINSNECKFLKPFDQCSKTSMQAERILKKIGKPLNLIVNHCVQKLENNKLSHFESKISSEDFETFSANILHKKLVQKNNLFKSSEGSQYDEDKLLEELFYSDQSLHFGFDSILKLEAKEAKTTFNSPFT